MCGIAGLVLRRDDPEIGRTLQQLGDLMPHRGPDGEGFAVVAGGRFEVAAKGAELPPGRIGLAHRRLSIIDLTAAAAQPMTGAGARQALSYNGEIYNYLELRAAGLGDSIVKSSGDSEVLLRLLTSRWSDALEPLIGMFAFAFVDLERNKLLLARDAFGIKPLHYLAEPDRFAFASEIRPLIALMRQRPAADALAIHRYLRHAATDMDDRTFVAGIRQVPAGHAVELDLDDPARFRLFPWWQRPAEGRAVVSAAAAAEELRMLFLDSVRLHLRADIPVATTLSGGVDSSGIVAAVRAAPDGPATVHAFTYRADHPALDETRFAELASQASNVVRHDVNVTADDAAHGLDALIEAQEQPFTTTSIFAQAAVFRAVRDAGFKVAMDGQGADEMFAGYHVFRAARIASLLRRGKLVQAIDLLGRLASGTMLAGALVRLLPASLARRVRSAAGRPDVPDWGNRAWFERHAASAIEESLARPSLREELADSFWRTSLPMLLRYADRNAMAVSVENRVPYLAPALVRFAAALPDDLLIDDRGTMKRVLRDALRGLVPDPILDRRDKIGFQTPEAQWLVGSTAFRDKLSSMIPERQAPCFSPTFHARARQMIASRAHDPAIWRGLCLSRWSELSDVEIAA